jgi:hypothetical protein
MSNIQLKKDVLVSLSTTAREVYLAGTKPMIRDIKDKNVVAESVAIAVNRVIADKGLNMEKDDIQLHRIFCVILLAFRLKMFHLLFQWV